MAAHRAAPALAPLCPVVSVVSVVLVDVRMEAGKSAGLMGTAPCLQM